MFTHLAYRKHQGKIWYLTKDKKEVDILSDECIMNYVTLSRMIGAEALSVWTVISLKEIVLTNKDIIQIM